MKKKREKLSKQRKKAKTKKRYTKKDVRTAHNYTERLALKVLDSTRQVRKLKRERLKELEEYVKDTPHAERIMSSIRRSRSLGVYERVGETKHYRKPERIKQTKHKVYRYAYTDEKGKRHRGKWYTKSNYQRMKKMRDYWEKIRSIKRLAQLTSKEARRVYKIWSKKELKAYLQYQLDKWFYEALYI